MGCQIITLSDADAHRCFVCGWNACEVAGLDLDTLPLCEACAEKVPCHERASEVERLEAPGTQAQRREPTSKAPARVDTLPDCPAALERARDDRARVESARFAIRPPRPPTFETEAPRSSMRPATMLFVVLIVLVGVFCAMTLERFRLQDSRIRWVEDRIDRIEPKLDALDMRLEIRHAL